MKQRCLNLILLGTLAGGCQDAEQEVVTTYDEQGRILQHPQYSTCEGRGDADSLRILSWNIAAAQMAGIDDVVTALRDVDADIIALQEVDQGTDRSGNVDQAQRIGDELGYATVFAESLPLPGGAYGLALLSRLPITHVERENLRGELSSEPRIVLDVTVCVGPDEFRILNTHADFLPEAAADQLDGLGLALGELDRAALVGDLNLRPGHEAVSALLQRTGAQDVIALHDEGPTRGQRRVDYILLSEANANAVGAASRVETHASDHQLLLVDLSP